MTCYVKVSLKNEPLPATRQIHLEAERRSDEMFARREDVGVMALRDCGVVGLRGDGVVASRGRGAPRSVLSLPKIPEKEVRPLTPHDTALHPQCWKCPYWVVVFGLAFSCLFPCICCASRREMRPIQCYVPSYLPARYHART